MTEHEINCDVELTSFTISLVELCISFRDRLTADIALGQMVYTATALALKEAPTTAEAMEVIRESIEEAINDHKGENDTGTDT